tara:strand:- start:1632 stop:3200 length:1569 start_codon:yes stop_codon:yes gene_type:complete
MSIKKYETDVLIIGSGIAGLITALSCAKFANVIIVTKDILSESNTRYAQGGIAVALNKQDSPKQHFDDTMKAGCFHNNAKAVDILTKEGPDALQELLDHGLEFDTKNHHLDFAQEAAHSIPRVLHNKDKTGKIIITHLIKQVHKKKNITLLEKTEVIKLHTENQTCYGCYAIQNKEIITVTSSITCLATGGAGQLFKHTSNPKIATGDGLFLGYEAGCSLIDIEFMQFHPTSFCTNPHLNSYFLISEAIRGAGATLTNHNGDDFTKHYHPDKALAPRDIVTRSIFDQLQQGNTVYLDCRQLHDSIEDDFPTISSIISQQNLSLKKDLIPITPTAHYMMGGLLTNEHSQTNINQLYAIGEVACNGIHGANRLASNSLLDGLVFANRAAKHIKHIFKSQHQSSPPHKKLSIENSNAYSELSKLTEIHTLLWSQCGIIRHKDTLQKSLTILNSLLASLSPLTIPHNKVYHHAILAKLIITAALNREEPLGTHFITPSKSSPKKSYWITQNKETPLEYHDSFPSPC